MSRDEFMRQLERLLEDVAEEEKRKIAKSKMKEQNKKYLSFKIALKFL